MRCIAIVLGLLFQFLSFAQTANFGRPTSDTLPAKFLLDVPSLREHIYKGIPQNIKEGEYERDAVRFAHNNACSITELISNGEVYSDWPEIEAYVNEILTKVMPDELKKDSVIHAYVTRDGSPNAFMTPSGHTFIHIGILPNFNNEASFAAVLCHELAHYYLRHSLNTFIKREHGKFDMGLFGSARFSLSSLNSIRNELQADSIAMVWLHNSGYSVEGMISSFEFMHRNERNVIKQREDDWELTESSHPLSIKRLEAMREFYNKHKSNNGKNFLVSETLFTTFKEAAKPEILKYYLDGISYNACIDNAFRFHLYDPDNSVYVYYLMEAIRRKCYLAPDKWNKLFITDNYYDSISVDNHRHKEKMTDHLFKKFDFTILKIPPSEAVKVKARFYWRDLPKFTTYEEAFVFFYNLSQALNCHECVLTNALSFTKDKEARNRLIDKYLAFTDIKHRDFAVCLKEGTITKKLNDRKLLCFNNFMFNIQQAGERVQVQYRPEDEKNVLQPVLDSVMLTQKSRTPLMLHSLKYNQLNKYNFLAELQNFSYTRIISQGEKTELHIFNPSYWEFLLENKVNEIEFLNAIYYDEYNGRQATGAEYMKIASSGMSDLFGHQTNIRTYRIFISSIRQVDNSLMKVRYGSEEVKLKTKDSLKPMLISGIRYELSMKEKFAKERDAHNKYNEEHY
ncbi:MAG TPA: M48 family metallopeptidase [Bacteroidia bacterium]|jgi:hypothetical protein